MIQKKPLDTMDYLLHAIFLFKLPEKHETAK